MSKGSLSSQVNKIGIISEIPINTNVNISRPVSDKSLSIISEANAFVSGLMSKLASLL